MNYSDLLHSYQARVEQLLPGSFQEVFPDTEKSDVARAAAYSLMDGGKRVRGVLVLAVCRMIHPDGNIAAAEHYAAAIEMVHAYSLIHDDLPCMDNDDLRRGKPSCHKAFGEATALLAGDALLTAAFDAVTRSGNSPKTDAEAVQLLAHAAGPCGMVYGQELDLAAEQHQVDEAGLLLIHDNKTGQLIRAAVALGAVAGGATKQEQDALALWATNIGLVFQIIDDILDVTSTAAELGKPIGSDGENHKTTFITLKGLTAAKVQATELTRQACSALRQQFGERCGFLTDFAEDLLQRTK